MGQEPFMTEEPVTQTLPALTPCSDTAVAGAARR